MPPNEVRDRLTAIRSRLGARAAGAWRTEGDRLILVAFVPAPDLPAPVALGFQAATGSVDLARVELGIVRAATTGQVAVSIAAGLPAQAGSGHWLRAFGAARSVAVPILGDRGRVGAVVSLALGTQPGDEAVAEAIRGVGWAV
jgi:hypothetical protein